LKNKPKVLGARLKEQGQEAKRLRGQQVKGRKNRNTNIYICGIIFAD